MIARPIAAAVVATGRRFVPAVIGRSERTDHHEVTGLRIVVAVAIARPIERAEIGRFDAMDLRAETDPSGKMGLRSATNADASAPTAPLVAIGHFEKMDRLAVTGHFGETARLAEIGLSAKMVCRVGIDPSVAMARLAANGRRSVKTDHRVETGLPSAPMARLAVTAHFEKTVRLAEASRDSKARAAVSNLRARAATISAIR